MQQNYVPNLTIFNDIGQFLIVVKANYLAVCLHCPVTKVVDFNRQAAIVEVMPTALNKNLCYENCTEKNAKAV